MPFAVSYRTKDVIEVAASATGYPIVVEEDPGLDVWSSTRLPRKGERVCLIRYKAAYAKFLDYLVAHECGHIYRFFSAVPEERLLPAIDPQVLRSAKQQIAKESWRKKNLIPKYVMEEFLNLLCSGLVRQVTNIPADCRIEKWIYENFEPLRDVQAAAVRESYRMMAGCLSRQIREHTPPSIYLKSNSINYPLVKTTAGLLDQPNLTVPYCGNGIAELGEKLDSHLGTEDTAYAGDVRAADDWAKELDIREWYRWVRID